MCAPIQGGRRQLSTRTHPSRPPGWENPWSQLAARVRAALNTNDGGGGGGGGADAVSHTWYAYIGRKVKRDFGEQGGVFGTVTRFLPQGADTDADPALPVEVLRNTSLYTTKALCCAATAWILTVAQCSAIP